jgi:hypothetical protein
MLSNIHLHFKNNFSSTKRIVSRKTDVDLLIQTTALGGGKGGEFLHSFDLKNMILTHTMYFYFKNERNLHDLGLSINPILKYNQIQGWSGP